jgi:hypothetical protein
VRMVLSLTQAVFHGPGGPTVSSRTWKPTDDVAPDHINPVSREGLTAPVVPARAGTIFGSSASVGFTYGYSRCSASRGDSVPFTESRCGGSEPMGKW